MPIFQVYLNGKKVSTAGVGDTGVLGAHVSWVRRKGEHTLSKKPERMEEELRLHVGGLIIPTQEHVRWVDRDLKIGDEVRIHVAQDAKIDRPRSRERRDAAEDLRTQKRYVRGWPRNSDGKSKHERPETSRAYEVPNLIIRNLRVDATRGCARCVHNTQSRQV